MGGEGDESGEGGEGAAWGGRGGKAAIHDEAKDKPGDKKAAKPEDQGTPPCRVTALMGGSPPTRLAIHDEAKDKPGDKKAAKPEDQGTPPCRSPPSPPPLRCKPGRYCPH